jgi:hypothetical protein
MSRGSSFVSEGTSLLALRRAETREGAIVAVKEVIVLQRHDR